MHKQCLYARDRDHRSLQGALTLMCFLCTTLALPRLLLILETLSQFPVQMEIPLDNVQPTEITFLEKLFSSRFSFVFLVSVRNQECIMKVVS